MLIASTQVLAFTCFEPSFVAKLQDSPVVFVARITGAQLGDRDSYYESIIDFEALEVLKGKISFENLSTGPMGAGGTPFVIGAEYLVYATEEGRTWTCSDSRPLRPAEIITRPSAAKYELDALRILAKDDFHDIRPPWVMYDFPGSRSSTCVLRQNIRYQNDSGRQDLPGGSIIFHKFLGRQDYRGRGNPPVVQTENTDVHSLTANVSLSRGESIEDLTATLQIGQSEFELNAGAASDDRAIRHFQVNKEDVSRLLTLLDTGDDISIDIDHPEYGMLNAITRPPEMTTALEDFKACIE